MTMLEKAQECLGKGWSVIPAQPGGKKPLIEWSKYTERLPTKEETVNWWARWPKANIALITGRISGLIAVDVDTGRGGDPNKVFKDAETSLISRTGSGGFHLFYEYPDFVERVPNRVGKDGIDVRGDSGYVILPPSVHENGNTYEFIKNGPLGVCPEWVYQAQETTNPEQGGRWLSDLLAGVVHGGRNDACTKLVGYFAQKGMAREVALLLVRQWNEKNNPPLPLEELESTVRSVYKAEARKNPRPNTPNGHSAQKFSVMDFRQYMVRYGDAAVSWNIEDWLPSNTIAFVISPPGSYKTWLVLDLAVSIASGKPFLDKYAVNEPGPVLLIQQEDYHGQIAERLAVITAAKFNLKWEFDPQSEDFCVPHAPDMPVFFHPDRMLKFDNKEILNQLEQQIALIRPKLVILDPLYSAGSTDDYMAKTAEQMFVFKRMRDKYNCSFLVVHHTKKSLEGSSTREGAWGSQFLNAFLETGWQIRRIPEDPKSISMQRHFKVKSNPPDLKLAFDIDTGVPSKYEVAVGDFDVAKAQGNDGPNILELVEKEGPLTIIDIATKTGVHRTTITRKVQPLLKTRALVKRKDGKLSIPQDLPAI